MSTTKELVGEYIDIEIRKEYAESLQERNECDNALQVIQTKLKKKVKGIDHIVMEMDKKLALVVAEEDIISKEIARLKRRKNAIKRSKGYFNEVLLPIVIKEVGQNGVFETETAKYKLYETYGKVDVNEIECPKDYLKIRMVEDIDRKKARADAITAHKEGKEIPGVKIALVERVRRT
tara:strand:+ start:1063 stop:1596 length:534 start_codon:yes stop_codon:yes gene_type:complete